MKLKHLASLLMLLALGCTGAETTTAPADSDTGSNETASSAPAAEEALTNVSFTVTGMK